MVMVMDDAFKIGQRVRVNAHYPGKNGDYVGQIGEVEEILQAVSFPYYVRFRSNRKAPFSARELDTVDDFFVWGEKDE